MATIEAYLEGVSPMQRHEYEKIRTLIGKLVPDVEETLSYGMPAFKYGGKPLIYFGAFKDHMSLFPTGDPTIDEIEGVENFRTSKGTLQFTTEKPIPQSVLSEIIKRRMENIQNTR